MYLYRPSDGRRDTTGTMRIDDIENTVFTLINEQGEEIECDVLLTFDSEDHRRHFEILPVIEVMTGTFGKSR